MNTSVDVSVIIPTYNRLWCLPRAINSCLNNQCITEIIVVDDGSTDGTWDWLQSQKNIKSTYQKNQGQTYAVNNGLSQATGKYVRFLDSDDFLAEGMIDLQFLNAEENQSDLVYSRVDNYEEETGKITVHPAILLWDDFMEVQLSSRYGSHFLGMLFKTEWAKKVPRRSDFAFREDRMFLLEYGLLDPEISMVEGCAGYWVNHKEQMQANYSGWKLQVTNWQHLQLYKKILGELEQRGQLTTSRKKAAATVLWPLARWIAISFPADAANVVKWVYELDPGFKIPEKGLLGSLYNKLGFKRTEQLLSIKRSVSK